jgi:hypothetical protein
MASLQESVICDLNMGRGANSITTNTIFGNGAGGFYTSGGFNSAIGYAAGRAKSGCRKVSIGYKAGTQSLYGCDNVFIGSLTGVANYNGENNVMIGQLAGYGYAGFSVGVGRAAFSDGTPLTSVAVGSGALGHSPQSSVGVGFQVGQATYQKGHTFVGARAAQYKDGENITAIGACAGRFGAGYNNQTFLGFYAYHNNYVSNSVTVGHYPNTTAYVYYAWINVSDSRDKTDVENLPSNLGINFIRKLRPVSFKFDYRKEYIYKCGFEFGQKDGSFKRTETNYGFLAQEIEQAINELNVTFDAVSYDSWNDKYSLKTLELLSPIIKAIQDLNNELDILEQQIG